MPEIPEMEIYRTFLESSVLGKIIKNIKVNREKSINYNEEELNKRAAGASIYKIERRGKAILLKLSNNNTLLAHMMLGYEPCTKCNSPILEKVVGGRNAYVCEFCQQ